MISRKPGGRATKALAVLMPNFGMINRWTFKLPPAEVVLLNALVDNAAVDLSHLPAYRKSGTNPYYVHICRLRKRLPKQVKIKSEWNGVYSISSAHKKILKEYER